MLIILFCVFSRGPYSIRRNTSRQNVRNGIRNYPKHEQSGGHALPKSEEVVIGYFLDNLLLLTNTDCIFFLNF